MSERALRIQDRFEAFASGEGGKLYAVLDGARDPRIAAESGRALKASSLYEGALHAEMEAVSPRLVALEEGQGAFCEWLLTEGWGKSWGVFLLSDAPFKKVRRHLRTFLMVKGEDGRQFYFRWYDPRVLRDYLPTCTLDERATVFGPIQAFILEDELPDTLLCYRSGGEHLEPEEIDLDSAPAPAPAKAPAEGVEGEEGAGVPMAAATAPRGPVAVLAEIYEELSDLWVRAQEGVALPESWAEAWAEETARASLLREALVDRPRDPTLMKAVRELSEGAEASRGDDLYGGLLALAREGCALDKLREGLKAFPLGTDGAFLVLAPRFEDHGGAEWRAALEGGCVTVGVLAELQELRVGLESARGEDEERLALEEAVLGLTGLHERLEASKGETSEGFAKLKTGVRRLQKRMTLRKAPTLRTALTGVRSLLVSHQIHREPISKAESECAAGILAALRGTRRAEAAGVGTP